MKRAGAHLHVIGLMDYAPMVGPELLQCEDEFLEGHEQSSRRSGSFDQQKMEFEANRNR